jgi:hypothetical protein
MTTEQSLAMANKKIADLESALEHIHKLANTDVPVESTTRYSAAYYSGAVHDLRELLARISSNAYEALGGGT